MGASAVTFSRDRSAGRRIFCANVEMKTSFLRPVRPGTRLTCLAQVVSGGDRVVFCEAEVRDDSDLLVAKASSTYVITPRD
jgi:acyl-coenzyme A thioesterase PaaI-like protein